MKFSKEIELIDLFCEYLEKHNCRYKRELRRYSYHNEGYIDIVIKKDDKFIGIEAKLNNFQSVLSQALSTYHLCHYAYILYPKRPNRKNIDKCKEYGIGLIIPKNNGDFEYLIRSKLDKELGLKIKRNWRENRIGRKLNLKEIPEGYDKRKLEQLSPTYEWVKSSKERKLEKLKKNHKSLDKFI
jgi:hypothetical protein